METENTYETMKQLQIEFYKIQCMNWIPSKSNGTGAAGRTFEILLDKKADKEVLPDYHGIELKTQIAGSKYGMSLFSMAFDNKPMEMQRLLNLCGYPDKLHPEFKVFQISVSGNSRKKVGFRYSCQLKVDYQDSVVRLLIFNRYWALIEQKMSWSFEQLRSRLEHKLSFLAFIPVKKWNLNGKIYFKYLDLQFYKLRDFNTFLKLIDDGIVSVTFKLGYYKSHEHYGEIYDHGTTFEIRSSDLDLLFEKVPL